MAGLTIGDEVRRQVLDLWAPGDLSISEISRRLRIDRATVRKTIRLHGEDSQDSEILADFGDLAGQIETIATNPSQRPPVLPTAPDIPAIVAEVIRQLGGHLGGPTAFQRAKPYKPVAIAPAPTGFRTEQKGNVSIVRIDYDETFEQRFLLTADRHWDNPHSDQDMQKRHLDEALRVGAGIIDIGDFFCAMQGKFDKRADKSSVRPEHQSGDYLDALVNTATDFFLPYARSFIRISPGNHETSVQKRCETDLTTRLVSLLNERSGGSIHRGGYAGWVMWEFVDGSGSVDRKKLWYIHGYGGGGPVTRGVIQTNRRAVYNPDADIIITGHIHEEWEVPITRSRLGDDGEQYDDEQLHIQVPTYKNEYRDGSAGWSVERGMPPKPVGATWLTFRKEKAGARIEVIRSRAK